MAKKYLGFTEVERLRKKRTKTWNVDNVVSGSHVGHISWYSPWRQYCFFPSPGGTVFSRGCLQEVVKFVEDQMALHQIDIITRRENQE